MKPKSAAHQPQTWPLLITTQISDTGTEFVLSGRLGRDGAAHLDVACREVLATGDTTLRLDLSGVDYISSPGLRLLARLRSDLAARGGQLTLNHLSDPVRLALDLAGLLDGFTAPDLPRVDPL